MAEFQEVMKQQKRMCKYYEKISDSCEGCPIYEEEIAYICCEAPCAIDIKDVDKAEKLIMSWAAEHPEPVYPTWGEWLISIGAARKIPTGIPFELHDGRIVDSPWETVVDVNTPIPADIAQKLGIEPKEG